MEEVLIDMVVMGEDEARVVAEKILFPSPACDKFEAAARRAFVDTVVHLMGDDGRMEKV